MKLKLYDSKMSLYIDLCDSKFSFLQLQKKLLPVENIVINMSSNTLNLLNSKEYKQNFELFLKTLSEKCPNAKHIYIAKGIDKISSDDIIFFYNALKHTATTTLKYFPKQNIQIIDLSNGELYRKGIYDHLDWKSIQKNNLIVTDNDVQLVKKNIEKIANLIKSKTSSPFEQHLLTLHYITQYQYRLEQNFMSPSLSRRLSAIFKSKAKYICCVGYSRLYTAIMRALGISATTARVPGHLRARVYIDDDKYNIHGIYTVDPTYLSQNFTDNNKHFYYNFYTNLSISSIITRNNNFLKKSALIEKKLKDLEEYSHVINETINHSFETRKIFFNYLSSLASRYPDNDYLNLISIYFKREVKAQALVHINKEFASQLPDKLDAICLEDSVKEIYKKDQQLGEQLIIRINFYMDEIYAKGITKDEVKLFFENINKIYDLKYHRRKNEYQNEIAYYNTTKEKRKRTLQTIETEINANKIHKMTCEQANRVLQKAMLKTKNIPEVVKMKIIKSITMQNGFSLSNRKLKNTAKQYIFLTDSIEYKTFQKIEKENSQLAISNNIEEMLGKNYLKNKQRNFTHLSDKEYQYLEQNTKDIPTKVMEAGMQRIKSLIKETDYNLFEQAPEINKQKEKMD